MHRVHDATVRCRAQQSGNLKFSTVLDIVNATHTTRYLCPHEWVRLGHAIAVSLSVQPKCQQAGNWVLRWPSLLWYYKSEARRTFWPQSSTRHACHRADEPVAWQPADKASESDDDRKKHLHLIKQNEPAGIAVPMQVNMIKLVILGTVQSCLSQNTCIKITCNEHASSQWW